MMSEEIATTSPLAVRIADQTETHAIVERAQSVPRLKHTVIEPKAGWRMVDFDELWRYRELMGYLVWRDVKIRYKQTVLGALWAIIQPLLMMAVFTIFFGRLGGMSHSVKGSYPVFVFAGLLPWTLFATAVTQAGQSLMSNANLVNKVYFPRLILPIAAMGNGIVDFLVSFVMLHVLMVWYGVGFHASLLLSPIFFLGTILTTVGFGTLLAALVIVYRDFRYVLAFVVQLWMFASPVAYPVSVVPERYRALYALNPMAGMISGFRSTLMGEPMDWQTVTVSTAVMLAFLVGGLFYFRKTERRFADIV
jgi:lipopolysaccharide transport system permease protein